MALPELTEVMDGASGTASGTTALEAGEAAFANFGSVGILIAGMSALMPERRPEIVPLALRAMVSGTLASGLSASMIGLLT